MLRWNATNEQIKLVRTRAGYGAATLVKVVPPWLCLSYRGRQARDAVDLLKDRLASAIPRVCRG